MPFRVLGSILPLYLIFIVVCTIRGAPLPFAHIFNVLPLSEQVHDIEPHFPFFTIIIALLSVAFQWLAVRDLDQAKKMQREEISSIRVWVWWGLPSIIFLFLIFVAAGVLSGNLPQRDLPYMNIAGLVPNSDAAGYYMGQPISSKAVTLTVGIFDGL